MTTESRTSTTSEQAAPAPAAPPADAARPETAAEKKKREAAEAKAAAPPREANPLSGLTEGRIVHYCLPSPNDPSVIWHRAAVVSRVVSAKAGKVDLHVFVPRSDFPKNLTPGAILMVDGCQYDPETKAAGTWHFPERA